MESEDLGQWRMENKKLLSLLYNLVLKNLNVLWKAHKMYLGNVSESG